MEVALINNGVEILKYFSRYGLYALVGLLFFSACAPIPCTYSVEAKRSSKIGYELDLDKYDIMIGAVVGDKTAVSDSVFIARIANGMAHQLELNFDMDHESIPVIMVSRDMFDVNSLYWRLYMMEREQKNAFIILDSLDVGYIFHDNNLYNGLSASLVAGNFVMDIKSTVKIDIYNNSTNKPLYSTIDTMAININIPAGRVKSALNDTTYFDRSVLSRFGSYGTKLAERLTFVWKKEKRIIYLDDGNKEWDSAFSYMDNFEFDKAIDVWLKYTSSKYSRKIKAAAAYNITVAYELLEKYELALEWLAYSEQNHKMDFVNALRKAIQKKME